MVVVCLWRKSRWWIGGIILIIICCYFFVVIFFDGFLIYFIIGEFVEFFCSGINMGFVIDFDLYLVLKLWIVCKLVFNFVICFSFIVYFLFIMWMFLLIDLWWYFGFVRSFMEEFSDEICKLVWRILGYILESFGLLI